ncbi:hypothetical protein [Paraglaciecola aestuariivivens]
MKRLVLLTIFFSHFGLAKDSVVMGVLIFPPFVMLDEKTSECKGDVIDRTREILADYIKTLEILCAPPSRMYSLMDNHKIDFTIHTKHTPSLPSDTLYVDTPFGEYSISLYSHNAAKSKNDIAAIKGFTYLGFRDKLKQQGYEFFDMPNTISAIQLFIKKKSSHLIAYDSAVEFYTGEKELDLSKDISKKVITKIVSHFAISAQSPLKSDLEAWFNDYAKKHQLSHFSTTKY